jgi:hypothetical protein
MDTKEPVQPSRGSLWIWLAWLNVAPCAVCVAGGLIFLAADAPMSGPLADTWATILLLTLAYFPVGFVCAFCCLVYAIVTFDPQRTSRAVAIAFPALLILGIDFWILKLIIDCLARGDVS